MPWYTASIILSCRLKSGNQTVFPVYENFTLFEATTPEEAFEKADHYAEEYAAIDDQLRLNGEPAYWKFEGIRKLIEVRDFFADELDVVRPGNGTEVSYSYMEVKSEKALRDLASGQAVEVRYGNAADQDH